MHRSQRSEAGRARIEASDVNVGSYERVVSALGGGAMLAAGASRGRRSSLLGWALMAGGAALVHRGITGRSATYRRLGIPGAIESARSITIARSPGDVYSFWRDFTNLPRFMDHVESVEILSDRISHWKIKEGPFTFEYDAEIVQELPERRIVWRSLPDAELPNRGAVELRLAPGGRGTELQAYVEYRPPGGLASAVLSRYLRSMVELQMAQDLARFKQMMETGEVATAARAVAELPAHRRLALSGASLAAAPAAAPALPLDTQAVPS